MACRTRHLLWNSLSSFKKDPNPKICPPNPHLPSRQRALSSRIMDPNCDKSVANTECRGQVESLSSANEQSEVVEANLGKRGVCMNSLEKLSQETRTGSECSTAGFESLAAPSKDGSGLSCTADAEDAPANALMSTVNRHINCLVDPVAADRFAALKSLHILLLGPVDGESIELPETKSLGPECKNLMVLSQVLEDAVVKPLLRRFSDSSEKCRRISILIVSRLLQEVPESIINLLPYVFPVICERLPLKALAPSNAGSSMSEVRFKALVVEPSEEVRVILVRLVNLLLKKATKLILPFASDVASVLMAVAGDNCPEVLVEAFSTLEFFGEIMEMKLKPVSKDFISLILHSLSHNQSRVRLAAVRAIHRLVLCGAHESIYDLTAYHDPNLIPIRAFYHPDVKTHYLALLASDRSVVVREEFLRTMASWLLKLPEKREHEVQLLPYVLSAFNDKSTKVQELAFELMECIGQQYEIENEDEIKDVKYYLKEDIQNIQYNDKNHFFPPSLIKRPCLGARIMVKRSFSILLAAVNGDLQSWKHEPKCLAADFLNILIIFVEENATMHLQALVLSMIKACCNPLVEKKIANCANLLGFFIDPSTYLEILLPRISREINENLTIQQVGKALKVLSWMIKGTRLDLVRNHIPEICSVLTNEELMTSVQQKVSESIVAVLETMVEAWDSTCEDEALSLLWLLLYAGAIAEFCKRSSTEVECILERLSKSMGHESSTFLIVAYIDTLLSLLPSPQFWASHSLDVLVFCRLLEESGFAECKLINKLFTMSTDCLLSVDDKSTKLRFISTVQKMVAKSSKASPIVVLHIGILLDSLFLPCLKCGGDLLFAALRALSDILSQTSVMLVFNAQVLIVAFQELMRKIENDEKTELLQTFTSIMKTNTDVKGDRLQSLLEGILQQLKKRGNENRS